MTNGKVKRLRPVLEVDDLDAVLEFFGGGAGLDLTRSTVTGTPE